MKSLCRTIAAIAAMLVLNGVFGGIAHAEQVKIANGVLEGAVNSSTGIRSFK